MTQTYSCWKCGGALPELLLPLPRHEECPHCRAQLHVCRMCEWFDPAAPQQCREPVADNVSDKQRANFCGYLQLSPRAFPASPDPAAASRRELDVLFGEAPSDVDPETKSADDLLRDGLEDLFRGK